MESFKNTDHFSGTLTRGGRLFVDAVVNVIPNCSKNYTCCVALTLANIEQVKILERRSNKRMFNTGIQINDMFVACKIF